MDTVALQALCDPKRLAIIELLAGGERCVCDVSSELGISNALASHHIKKLRDAGLVFTVRKGSWLHCRLNEDAVSSLARALDGLALRSAAAASACCSCVASKETP